jgi:hypothetical protein
MRFCKERERLPRQTSARIRIWTRDSEFASAFRMNRDEWGPYDES